MEICKRDPEAILEETMIEEITNEINKNIIERIRSNFPSYFWTPDNRKKYEDKFEVRIVGDNVMPYKVQHFIHELIEKDINAGKITRDDEHYKYEISLDDIHKVVYVYDLMFDKNKVIRYHQTEEEYKKLHEPTYIFDDTFINKFKPNYNNFIIHFDLI